MRNQTRTTRLLSVATLVFIASYSCLLFMSSEIGNIIAPLLLVALLGVNYFLLKIIAQKKEELNFQTKVACYSVVNIAAFLPTIIQSWGVMDSSFLSALLASIVLCSAAFALFSTKLPNNVTEEENPFYDLPDVLLQPRKSSGRANPIRVNTEHNNSVIIQIIVWVLIALLVLTPFHFFLM